MAVYAVAAEKEQCTTVDPVTILPNGLAFVYSTNVAYFDTNVTRLAIKSSYDEGQQRISFAPQTEFWIHAKMRMESVAGTGRPILTFSSTANSSAKQLELWNWSYGAGEQQFTGVKFIGGSAFVQSGLVTHQPTPGPDHFYLQQADLDMHIKLHATNGIFAVYVNGVNYYNFTGVLQTDHNIIDAVILRGVDVEATGSNYFSEVIVTDFDTRGARLATLKPNGLGFTNYNLNDFNSFDNIDVDVNIYADLNVVGTLGLSDYSGIHASINGKRPVLVKAVNQLKRYDVEAPAQVATVLRQSGTNYVNTLVPITESLNPVLFFQDYTVNPATGLAFTNAELNAMQFGIKIDN